MNPTLRKYSSFEEMKRDEYRYWQSRPAYERFEAVEEMVKAAWELRGWAVSPSEPRSEWPLVRMRCPWHSALED